MLSVAEHIEQPATAVLERDEEIRKILLDIFQFHEGLPLNEKSVMLMGADLGVKFFNVFYSLRNPNSGLGYRVVMDLTVNLNGNPLWVKHGTVFMPILHAALQAQSDYALLSVEKANSPNITKDDDIRAECKLAPLEIFVMLAFIVGGQELMQIAAMQLKRRLAPYIG